MNEIDSQVKAELASVRTLYTRLGYTGRYLEYVVRECLAGRIGYIPQ